MTVSPAGVDKLIDANGGPVWSREAGFTALREYAPRLNDTVVDIAKRSDPDDRIQYQ